jgi:tetratricopeptide (TPR) repeat protein
MQNDELIKQLDTALDMQEGGDYANALDIFEKLEELSSHPQDIAALRCFQVSCLTNLGRTKDAAELISRIDKNQLIFSKKIDYEYERARVERALGHTREALDLVKNALQMIEIANNSGKSTELIGDEVIIVADHKDELILNRDEIHVLSGALCTLQAILLAESGNCDEAILMLEAVPVEDLGWAEARILLGDCKIRKRLHKEAIEIYSSIISSSREIDPIHRETAIRNTGCAYYYMKEYKRALEYLTKVEHSYDENPGLKAELFEFIASTYSRLEMPQMAAKYRVFSKASDSVQ